MARPQPLKTAAAGKISSLACTAPSVTCEHEETKRGMWRRCQETKQHLRLVWGKREKKLLWWKTTFELNMRFWYLSGSERRKKWSTDGCSHTHTHTAVCRVITSGRECQAVSSAATSLPFFGTSWCEVMRHFLLHRHGASRLCLLSSFTSCLRWHVR